MAFSLFGRPKLDPRDVELRELRQELTAHQARIANPVAFHSESFIGFGDSSDARAIFANGLHGTADSASRVVRDRIQSLEMGAYIRRFVGGDFEDTPAFNHPLQKVLDRPTLDEATGEISHSGFQLWGMSVTQIHGVGESYLIVLHDGNDIPTGLQIAQPGTLEPLVERGRIVAYRVISQNTSATIRPRDIVRIWEPDAFKLYTSRSLMVRNATKLNADSHAQKHNEKFYENDATPKLAMTNTDSTSDFPTLQQQEELGVSWTQRFNRRFGRNKLSPVVVKPGWEVKVLDSQGDATSMVAMLTQTSQQVMEAFRVSPTMLGRNVDVNRAAAETARFTFDQNTIEPLTRMIADALTTQLASQFDQPNPEARLIVKYKPFIARDKEFLLRQEQQDLALKVRAIDEVRENREPTLPPVSWGALPVGTFGDVPYTGEEPEIDLSGFNLDEPEETELPPEVDDESSETPVPEEEERARTRAQLPIMRRLRAHFTPENEWKRQVQREQRWTPIFRGRQLSLLTRQRDITIERLLKRGLRWKTTRTFPGLSRQTGEELAAQLFPLDGWQELFRETTEPVRVGAYVSSADAATTAITGQTFRLTEAAREAVQVQNLSHYVFTNRTTQDAIAAALDVGLAEGESIDQVARRIAQVFGDRKSDATRIARTEMAAAVSSAQIQGFEQTGVVERSQWNSSLDAAVRDAHLIDGQTVALGEDFTLQDGDRGSAPADPKFDVSNRVNCRCFVTPVFFDEDTAGLGFPIGAEGAL